MKITAKKYSEMLMYGAEVLNGQKEEVNNLNVFPVPDGDTGSNMNMTFQAGVNSILNNSNNEIAELAKSFSKGLLMGARGNSGVILSQFFRGIAEGLEGIIEASVVEFHKALQQGVVRAYGSVIKAVEGTILTVAREMVENTSDNTLDFEEYLTNIVKNAHISLENTPNILPILKEANVVDSGGAGLVYIFEGMLANLKGEKVEIKQNFESFRQTEEHILDPKKIIYRYCTEILIKLKNTNSDINVIREKLITFGDSIVAIIDEDILKVHVHTEQPTKVFEYGSSLGEIITLKSENMRIQAEEEIIKKSENKKDIGIVTVVSSARLGDLFEKIQDVELIIGGQTLNPSIEDITKAIYNVNAKNVILMPNNSNIMMAANAAKEMITDVNIEIIPTKHMTQALECLINIDLESTFEQNIMQLNDCLDNIVNIEITHAIKDTSIEGVLIKKDDYLGIINGSIKYSMSNIEDLLKRILDLAINDDAEIINILVGDEGSVSYIESLEEYVENQAPFTEYKVYNTNQPVYDYLISFIV